MVQLKLRRAFICRRSELSATSVHTKLMQFSLFIGSHYIKHVNGKKNNIVLNINKNVTVPVTINIFDKSVTMLIQSVNALEEPRNHSVFRYINKQILSSLSLTA